MSNTVYNKVTINGTSYIDLSQDTVSDASHIRQGYVGHLNDGTTVTGTYSGGSSIQTKTIIPEQTVTASSNYTQLVFNEPIVDGTEYIVTVNGNTSRYTAASMYGGLYLWFGVASPTTPGVEYVANDNRMYLDTLDSSLYGTYTIKVEQDISGSSSGDYVRTIICPSQTITPNSSRSSFPSNWATALVAGNYYVVIFDNTEYICTCVSSWSGSANTVGEVNLAYGTTGDFDYPFLVATNSNDPFEVVTADTNTHTLQIDLLEFPGDAISLTEKTITVNGTYSAEDDSADGYSSVTVNVPTGTARTSSDLTVSGATVNVPAGLYSSAASASVASGSASGPSTVSGSSASVSTGTNTLTLSKTVSVTPVVNAGYVSSGTATNASVSLTASVTTKAAATITPTTSNQTIASGTYLTGTQTIAGDTNLVAGNIKDGTTIFGVTGTYTGSGSGKNIQYSTGRYEVSSTSYTATNHSIKVSKAGSYKCYWVMDRNTTSGTSGSQLYKNGSAVGSTHTSWTYNNNNRNGMNCEETLTFAANDVIVVRARSRSTSYVCGVSNFFIVEQ